MATRVQQTYSASQNVSITVRDGVISLVSIWTTGADASQTERVGTPADAWRNPFPLSR